MQPESFTDLLEDYGRNSPSSMVYRPGEDFVEWQNRFYQAVDSLRGSLPGRVPLETETIDTREEADYTCYTLKIRVSEISTMAAYLLIPRTSAKGDRLPGLVVSHGHYAGGADEVCGVSDIRNPRNAYGLLAVRAGFVVIAPAWWGWKSRDGHVNLVGNRDKCNVIQTMAAMYGINVLSLHIQDGQAAVDLLSERPEVDPDRIGCIGNSYGGRLSMWLAIFEERIKACVAASCMNTFRERSLKLSCCGIQYLPGILKYGDVPELFSLIAPRPLQLQAGKGDRGINDADRDMIAVTVRNAYLHHHAVENINNVQHPDGHLLNWQLAERFLNEHLRIPATL